MGVTFAVLQSSDVPATWSNPVWADLAAAGVENGRSRIAVDAASGYASLGAPLSCLLGFAAAFLLAIRRDSSWPIVRLLVLSGTIYAAIGFLVDAVAPGNVLLEAKVAYTSDFTGPFVNRNTAASYLGLCSLAASMLAFRAFRANGPPGTISFRSLLIRSSDLLVSRAAGWSAIALFLLASTMLTGSRAGIAATVCSLLAMATILSLRLVRSPRSFVAVAAATLAVAIFLVETLGASLATRIQEGFGGDGRRHAWSAVVDEIAAHHWTGTGAGTFGEAFPSIRPLALGYNGIWERAHSTPLELAMTIGLPATLLVLAGWLLLIVLHVRGVISARESYALPVLGVCALLLMSIHGVVDFSLQIPGFAIPFAVLVGTTFGHTARRAAARSRARPG
jgi:O-antigen ligase